MKKIIQIILFIVPIVTFATTVDELIQVHALTPTERTALSSPITEGTLSFGLSTKKLYVYAENQWRALIHTPKVSEKTGDYTLIQKDNGSILTFNSSTPITLTIPSGFPIGYNVSIYQIGIGEVTITESGTTIKNRLQRFKTAGKDAGVGIVSTSTDIFHVTGDLKK